MNREDFAQIVRDIIEEEITTGIPCSCCQTVDIFGIAEAVQRITEAAVPPAAPPPAKDYVQEYGYDPGPTRLNAQGWPIPN